MMLIELTSVEGKKVAKVLVSLYQVTQIIDLGGTDPAPKSRIEFANGTEVRVKETIQEIAKIAGEGAEPVVRLA
jgi:hypothetical protein